MGLDSGDVMGRQAMASDSADLQHVCDRFVSHWRDGEPVRIDQMLTAVDQADRATLLAMLLRCELRLRRARGEVPGMDEYLREFPDDRNVIERHFDTHQPPAELSDSTALHTVRDDGPFFSKQVAVRSHIGLAQSPGRVFHEKFEYIRIVFGVLHPNHPISGA